MAFVVEFETGPAPGRRVRIMADQPRALRLIDQGQEAGHMVFDIHEGCLRVVNRSSMPLIIAGQQVNSGLLHEGERLIIGRDTAVVLRDTAPAASSDSQRRRRAISAEGEAEVSAPRQGLVARVSSAFATRAERAREEALHEERRRLLAQVGRRALEGERFGIPPAAINALLTGRAVRLDPSAVDRQALEWWRQARDRLLQLDAEISALRRVIGLGPDPDAQAAPLVRHDLRRQEQQTFEALDSVPTQAEMDPIELPPEALPPQAPLPPRRRPPMRRVR